MGTRIGNVGVAALLACLLGACGEESADGPPGGATPTTTSTTSTTGGAGGGPTTSGITGGLGGAAAMGGAGATGGEGGAFECEDDALDEPNDTPALAVNLLVISDNDPDTPYTIDGVIRGRADVDWYTYLGVDETGGYVDPEQQLTMGATHVELCAYYWCVDPSVWQAPGIGGDASPGTHVCPAGTYEDEVDLSALQHGGASLGVFAGCCTETGTTSMHLGEDLYETFHPFDCQGTGTNDGMKVFFRVSAAPESEAEVCEPYVVAHHF